MNFNELTGKQLQATIAMFLIGSSVVAAVQTDARQDTWICIILGYVCLLPMLWVHTEFLNLYPGQSFYDTVENVCGKIIGKIVNALFTVYSLCLGALVVRVFSEFIHIVNMPETPMIVILIAIIGVAVYLMKHHVCVLGRIAKFTLPIMVAMVALTILIGVKDMDLENLKPVLKSNGPSVIAATTFTTFAIPMGEIVTCSPLFAEMNRKEKIFPVFLKGSLIAFLVLLAAFLRNLLILGGSVANFAFPSYEAVSVVGIGEFFNRIEILIGVNLLLAGFIKTCVLVYSFCRGFAKIFEYQDYQPLVAPCGMLFLAVSFLIANNSEEMFKYLKYLPYYSFPFQVALPVLLLIAGKIRIKMQTERRKAGKKSRKAAPEPAQT